MEQIISKQELQELKKIKGEVRGGGMKSYAKFILQEQGKHGLKKLEQEMSKLGFDIDYMRMGETKFFPISLEAVTLAVIKKVFNYGNEKFTQMSKFAIKFPFIIRRVLMAYLFSPKRLIEKTPNMWRTYYTLGDMKITEYQAEKRYMIVRLENFKAHPLHCKIIKGYLCRGFEMITKKEVTCKETKCIHKGDEYHEFLAKW